MLLAGNFSKRSGVVIENMVIPLLGRPREETMCGLRIDSYDGGHWDRVRFGY